MEERAVRGLMGGYGAHCAADAEDALQQGAVVCIEKLGYYSPAYAMQCAKRLTMAENRRWATERKLWNQALIGQDSEPIYVDIPMRCGHHPSEASWIHNGRRGKQKVKRCRQCERERKARAYAEKQARDPRVLRERQLEEAWAGVRERRKARSGGVQTTDSTLALSGASGDRSPASSPAPSALGAARAQATGRDSCVHLGMDTTAVAYTEGH
jgi:hypothetical protein